MQTILRRIKTEELIFLLITFLLIGSISAYFWGPSDTIKSLAFFLSGISTVGIFLLTAFYVIYTNRQIRELREQRELQVQPLPNITIVEGEMESPKVKFDPHAKGEISLIVTFCISIKIKNVGNGNAILVDTYYRFRGKKIKKEQDRFFTERFHVLEQGEEVSYHYLIDDDSYEALNALNKAVMGPCLLEGTIYDLILRSVVIYRNLLGRAFLLQLDHVVYVHEKDKELISNWLAKINSFRGEFLADIARYDAIYQRDPFEGLKIFDSEIKEKFYKRCPKATVKIQVKPLSQSFKIKPLTPDDLNSLLKRIYHGIPLPSEEDSTSVHSQNTGSVL